MTSCSVSAAGLSRHAHASDVAEANFDGLADGQELFVKTAKTPKRYPTRDWAAVYTEKVDLSLGSPAWAIARAVRPI